MRLSFIAFLSVLLSLTQITIAQTTDDLLNLLTRKGAISQGEADSIKSLYAAKQRDNEAKLDSFPLRLGRSMDLSGYTQVGYQNFQQSGKINGFYIKRARLDFQGHFSSLWDYRLLVDFVGTNGAAGSAPTGGALISPTLIEAFFNYKPFTFLNIKAGQMIIPFSQENMTQDRNLDMIERPQVVNALVGRKGDASNGLVDSIGNQNGRDIGIQANGSIIKINGNYLVDYTFALLDGAGINTLDNNSSKDIDARLVFHPLKILSFGGSYYNGYDRFTSSPTKNQERIRWGTEVALNYQSLLLKAEYIRGQEGNSNPIIHDGYYAELAYSVWRKKLQGVFRYDWYNPNTAKTNVVATYYDFGLNYFFNVWTKLQLYYSLRRETGPQIANNLFEAQLQLAF